MYRLDEHHEAYLAWWDCRRNSLGVPYHLIHIDEHADFGMPSLSSALPFGPKVSLAEVAELTYHQLTIGTFIVPAYLAGFFDRLSWVKPRVARTRVAETIGFDILDTPPFIKKGISKKPSALIYQQVGWENIDIGQTPWMLDICLDAFACNPFPSSPNLKMEINKRQYEIFQASALNLWHARYGGNFKVWETNGRFFAGIQEYVPVTNIIDETLIWSRAVGRMNKLKKFLSSTCQPPEVVTLSRSVKSGYTPERLANRLETAIVDILIKLISNLDERNLPNG
jgi:hypothetical protein